ncbi:cadherin-like beta sandwich domain-containing protein [Mesorhizobium sp. BAC0120]|uniref:cadherin-like beta sandwich domain-containing protein n=1 Tax=Mesorhizobium sp. BAC0120 TaxID=3090670 RepID=UPI00298C57D1|nr:cadherin-like beta sandwich domain-containing protein [Mesorhizobium sp. BAC0120]MDW6025068.1 cadherin-like beta sandwich domain-containing protein [Mesorhizobium sp. BAC0120]
MLSFEYTVQPGDMDFDGVQLGSAIELNGSTIQNAVNEPANPALNNVGNLSGVMVNTAVPTVITAVVGNPPSNSTAVTFRIVFSEPVTGLTLTDLILSAAGTVKGTLSSLQTADNITYTVLASNISGTGTLRLDVPANSAQNSGGNGNLASSGTAWTAGPSSNADLSQLQPGAGTLSPAFASNVLSYSISVANSVADIAFTPTASEPNARIAVNGSPVASGTASSAIALPVGTTTIRVVVTAQDGATTRTYEVTVTRAASAVAELSSLVPSEGTLDPAFSPARFAYDVVVGNQVDRITFTPTASVATARIAVNGAAVSSGAASAPIALSVGANQISIVVTAQDGTTTQTYEVTVTRGASAIAELASLVPSSGRLEPAFTPARFAYDISVGNQVDSITFTPTVSVATARIAVNGAAVSSGAASAPIALSVGANQVSIVVTAQDGTTTQTYEVTVTRAASAIAELASLVPSSGTLEPAFTPARFAYDISVGNQVDSITFTPTVSVPTATVAVKGAAVSSGAASAPIALSVGANQVPIVVTAQDGTTTQTYTVTVTRSKPALAAASRTIQVLAGTTVMVDLTEGASGGPFTTAAVTLLPSSDSGTVHLDAQQKQLSFDASATFAGSAAVRFTLSNAFGTSAPATITFSVIARPDPSKDPEVVGLLRAQIDAAKRFAQYQTRNFNNRLEQLHNEGDRRRNSLDIRLGYRPSDSDGNRADYHPQPDQSDGSMPSLLGYASDTNISSMRHPQSKDSTSPIQGPDLGRFAIWSGGFVDFAQRDNGHLDIDSTAVGVSAGFDYRFSDRLVAGFGIGYGRDRSDVGDNGTTNRATAYSAAIYGSYKPIDNVFLDGLIGGSWLDFDSERYVTANSGFASGERDGRQIFGSLTAAYEFRNTRWLVSPYGRFELSRSFLDSFTEDGGGIYGLAYGNQTVDTAAGVLGIRASYAIKMDWGTLTPGVRAEFTHDFAGSSHVQLGYMDIGSLPYVVDADSAGADYATLGLSMDAALLNDWSIGVEYRTALGSGRQDHALGLKVGTRF